MIDAGSINEALTLIATDVRDLTVVAKRAPTDTITGRHQQRTERLLERAVGRMIEINHRVVSAMGQPSPDDHASFVALGRSGILSQDVADRMAAAVGLRNAIVHGYAAVDAVTLNDAVERLVADGPVYLDAIARYLGSRARS